MNDYLNLIGVICIVGCIWILHYRIRKLEKEQTSKNGDKE